MQIFSTFTFDLKLNKYLIIKQWNNDNGVNITTITTKVETFSTQHLVQSVEDVEYLIMGCNLCCINFVIILHLIRLRDKNVSSGN